MGYVEIIGGTGIEHRNNYAIEDLGSILASFLANQVQQELGSEPDCVNSLMLSESVNKWAAKWRALQEILNVRPKFSNEGRDLHLQYQSYKTCLARPISATMRSRK